jgi:hypothetical protein
VYRLFVLGRKESCDTVADVNVDVNVNVVRAGNVNRMEEPVIMISRRSNRDE